jgi:hypothetical protein
VTAGRRPSLAGWRDTILFLTGIGLIVYEAVIRTGPERPTLLILYGGMVGLPAVLRSDERRTDDRHPKEKSGDVLE